MSETRFPPTGEREGFYWLSVPTDGRLLCQITKDVPEIVLGKVVAVTSLDSGPLSPCDEEKAMGWHRVGDILWTTPINETGILPCGGWDEWYVFEKEKELPRFDVLVNYSCFRLDDLEAILKANPTWDKGVMDVEFKLQETFWRQMKELQPLSFLAENDAFFTFAGKDATLFRRVETCCRHRALR